VNDEQLVVQQVKTNRHTMLTTCEDGDGECDNDDLSDVVILLVGDSRALPSIPWQSHSERRPDRVVVGRDEDEGKYIIAVVTTDSDFFCR